MKGKYLCTCFVDFSKAYYYIDLLFKKLCKKGVSDKILQLIKSMYSSSIVSITFGEKYSAVIETTIGLKQGDPLSTTLFNIYINSLLKIAKNSPLKIFT